MDHKKKVLLILCLALIAAGVGYILTNATTLGICKADELFSCQGPLNDLGAPIFLISGSLLLPLLALLFIDKNIFKVWLKCISSLIILSIIWIASLPESCSDFFNLCLYKENAAMFSATTILIISLLTITYKTIQLKRQSKQSPKIP